MVLRYVNKILSIGTENQVDQDLIQKTKLINLFAVIASLACFPYLFVYYLYSWKIELFLFIALLAFMLVVLLNKHGKYESAKFLLIFATNLTIFVNASFFGRTSGEHLVYIPILLGSILTFSFQEKFKLFFSVTFSITCLAVLELSNYNLFSNTLLNTDFYSHYLGNLLLTIVSSIIIAFYYLSLVEKQKKKNKELIKLHLEIEETINYFSTSLFGKNTQEEILWDVAKNCISRLGFEDCVVYLLDKDNDILQQKAAFGPKNPNEYEILSPIDIPVGKGIVGKVALTGEPCLINDTTQNQEYLVDDQFRYSELAVPIIYQKRVLGVIDSENSEKGFFKQTHLNILKTIASLTANKLMKAEADEEKRKAEEAKLMAAKLKEIDQLKTQFFTNISHEFRTPLTIILAHLNKKINDNTISREDQEDLIVMQRNALQLLNLINEILDISKFEAGLFKLQLKKVNLNDVIKYAGASFSSLATSRNVKFTIKNPGKEIWGEFDVDKLNKIINNLLSNAFKFTPENGSIVLQLSQDDNKAIISVKDSGIGISRQNLDKIFDRFYQVEEQSDIAKGTGIGLALIKELAAMHQGTVSVNSKPGKGSVFTIILPIDLASTSQKATLGTEDLDSLEEELVHHAKDNSLVLIVEDNEDLRKMLKKVLSDDFNLLLANDGEEGERIAMKKIPDLIVTDVMMPKKDGNELCKSLKSNEITNHIPVIMLTAKADQQSKMEGLEYGADAYLTKPFAPEELTLRIKKMIGQRKILKDKFSKDIFDIPRNGSVAPEKEFLKKTFDIIDHHLAKPDFSVEKLQLELGMSRMQLHRKLKAITHLSANELIRKRRIRKAAAMINEKRESISQIAYAVGFNNLSYFSKCFKSEFGKNPSEMTPQ